MGCLSSYDQLGVSLKSAALGGTQHSSDPRPPLRCSAIAGSEFFSFSETLVLQSTCSPDLTELDIYCLVASDLSH